MNTVKKEQGKKEKKQQGPPKTGEENKKTGND